jgi:hypothetical protein
MILLLPHTPPPLYPSISSRTEKEKPVANGRAGGGGGEGAKSYDGAKPGPRCSKKKTKMLYTVN